MWKVMTDYVIMHYIIVEDERDNMLLDQGWQFLDELVKP
jgi:hypothetical protein